MVSRRCHIILTDKPLAARAPMFPADGKAGAIVDFYGVVRGQEKEAPIEALEYEAYLAMAEKQLAEIAERLAEKFGAMEVEVEHRIGAVPAGEPSLHVRVRAAHRSEAFGLAEAIIDELKRDVPIWKKTPAK